MHYTNALLGAYALNLEPTEIFGANNLYQDVAGSQYQTINASGQFHSSANRTIKNNVRTLLAINVIGDTKSEDFNPYLTLQYLLKNNYDESTGLFADDLEQTGWAMIALGQYPGVLKGTESLGDNDNTIYTTNPLNKTIDYLKSNPEVIRSANVEAVATFISGLVGIGEDVTKIEWPLGENSQNISIVDYLVSQQKVDGSFGTEEATIAALTAFGDAQANLTIYERLKAVKQVPQNNETEDATIAFNFSVEGLDGDIVQLSKLNVTDGTTVYDVLVILHLEQRQVF